MGCVVLPHNPWGGERPTGGPWAMDTRSRPLSWLAVPRRPSCWAGLHGPSLFAHRISYKESHHLRGSTGGFLSPRSWLSLFPLPSLLPLPHPAPVSPSFSSPRSPQLLPAPHSLSVPPWASSHLAPQPACGRRERPRGAAAHCSGQGHRLMS